MEDHPRVGGEKPARRRAFKRPTGSPPRGRGKVLAALMPENRLGITPAWAGKSDKKEEDEDESGDHPRVGGEKGAGFAHGCGLLGSPPRGRGKVAPVAVRPRWLWITPAWAGKRCPTSSFLHPE